MRAPRILACHSIPRFHWGFRAARISSGRGGPAQPLNSASHPKSKLDTQTEASRKLRLRVVNLAATPRNPTATARVIAADCRRVDAGEHGRANGAKRAGSVLRYSPMILINTRLRRPPSNSP